MDLNSFLALVCGPYGPLVGVGLAIGYGLLRRRFPNLPSLPNGPAPVPAPAPGPALPIPAAPDFPILRRLLKLAGLPVPANLAAGLPAEQISALWSEVDALADAAAKHREGEVAALK